MRRTSFTAIMLALTLAVAWGFSYAQQGSTSGPSGWYGHHGWHGSHHMMGAGTSGPEGRHCEWMQGHRGHHRGPGGHTAYHKGGEALTGDEAQRLARDYIQGNPNLRVGEFVEKGDVYEATIVTSKEGSLVERIQIDKLTGCLRGV